MPGRVFVVVNLRVVCSRLGSRPRRLDQRESCVTRVRDRQVLVKKDYFSDSTSGFLPVKALGLLLPPTKIVGTLLGACV
jgi:hypothetical protein